METQIKNEIFVKYWSLYLCNTGSPLTWKNLEKPGNLRKPGKSYFFNHKSGKWGFRSGYGTIKTWKIFKAFPKIYFL